MQDFNLPGSLGNRNPQVSVGASALNVGAANASKQVLPSLLPVSISQSGSLVRISDQNNKLIAAGTTNNAINQPVTAAIGDGAQSIILFSQRKNLFDAIISAQQQSVILDATSKQPGLAKVVLDDTQKLFNRNAIVLAVSNQSLSLKLTPPLGDLAQVKIESKQLPLNLKPGQAVQIQIQQIGEKWVAKIISSSKLNTPLNLTTSANQSIPSDISTPSKQSPSVQAGSNDSNSKDRPQQGFSQTNLAQPSAQKNDLLIPLSRQSPLVEAIVKNVLQTGININQAPKVVESLIALMPKLQSPPNQISQANTGVSPLQLSSIVQQSPLITKLALSEQRQATVSLQFPVANVKLEQTAQLMTDTVKAKDLVSLPKAVEKSIERFFALPEKQRNQLLESIKTLPLARPQTPIDGQVISSTPKLDTVSVKGISNNAGANITSSFAKTEVPKAFVEQLSNLIRQHFVNASPTTENATNLTQVLSQLAQSGEANIRDFSKNVQQALLPLITRKEPDLAQIQALLQMPAMPVSSTSLAQIAPINNMVSGLVALLQISLATRLPQRQASASDKLGQILNQLTQTATSATNPSNSVNAANQPASNAKTLQEFSQLEQRNQLLRTLSRTLSNHQYSKLASAEASLQGTESLYYSLPSYTGASQRDIELLVKREPENKKASKDKSEQTSTWHLTMLMDIGEHGELLSKCKLKENEVSLDIYTSSESLKIHVLDFLPLLNKRLTAFGLDIISSQCQLGKIPETLRPKPYQLLHTQA